MLRSTIHACYMPTADTIAHGVFSSTFETTSSDPLLTWLNSQSEEEFKTDYHIAYDRKVILANVHLQNYAPNAYLVYGEVTSIPNVEIG